MIVVLGAGREARAWLEGHAPQGSDILVLDEAATGGPGGTAHATSFLGHPLLYVDLDDAAGVRAAIGDRRVTQIVRSPGVSPYRNGTAWLSSLAPTATPTGLWLADFAPDDLILVSGTKGKSTVTAMTAHLLRSAGRRTVLAGNIGVALSTIDAAAPRDDLVLEVSSYQLADLVLRRPAIAAGLTTLFVDHVPWHGSVARYHADKLRILELAAWRVIGPQVVEIGMAAGRYDAVAGHPTPQVMAALAEVGMYGVHEGQAAMLALALAARRTGTDATALVPSLATYEPLPHRLRSIGTHAGRTFIDDSISTVPEATLAAIATWSPRGPVTLLLGGDDRGQALEGLVAALADPNLRAALMPPMGERLAEALARANPEDPTLAGRVTQVPDLAAALAWADAHTPAGGAVVLSPAAPSFGAFRDFAHRGDTFASLVAGLGRADMISDRGTT